MSDELSDWKQPGFGERDTTQRRRILSSTRATADPEASYSRSEARTAYRDTIDANANSLSQSRAAAVGAAAKDRSQGGTWAVSPGLVSALNQSGTTMKDYQPMQRDVNAKVRIDKIQQPKEKKDQGVVRLEQMRVRKVGMTSR